MRFKKMAQRGHSKTNQNFDNLEFEAKIVLNTKKRSGRVGKRAPKKSALKTKRKKEGAKKKHAGFEGAFLL